MVVYVLTHIECVFSVIYWCKNTIRDVARNSLARSTYIIRKEY